MHRPLETMNCPYCGTVCDNAEFVDIGVGREQVTPFACDNCQAVQAGQNNMHRLTEAEIKMGCWFRGVV